MIYCHFEGQSFPDGEFKKNANGALYHTTTPPHFANGDPFVIRGPIAVTLMSRLSITLLARDDDHARASQELIEAAAGMTPDEIDRLTAHARHMRSS